MVNAHPAWNDPILLQDAIDSNTSLARALEYLGLAKNNQNYKKFKQSCQALGIDPTFPQRYSHSQRTPDELVFVVNSPYRNNRINVKQRALDLGYVDNCCRLCGIGPEWNYRPLVLQLDHINGVNNDHRPENLRMLCPNCHTQTETYAGRTRPTTSGTDYPE